MSAVDRTGDLSEATHMSPAESRECFRRLAEVEARLAARLRVRALLWLFVAAGSVAVALGSGFALIYVVTLVACTLSILAGVDARSALERRKQYLEVVYYSGRRGFSS